MKRKIREEIRELKEEMGMNKVPTAAQRQKLVESLIFSRYIILKPNEVNPYQEYIDQWIARMGKTKVYDLLRVIDSKKIGELSKLKTTSELVAAEIKVNNRKGLS